MTAYAMANVHATEFGPNIVEYLERIDATLEPYSGRFLVHGGNVEVLEGRWGQDAILIEFPDREQMRAWYDSPDYQQILPLRTKHMTADIVVVDAVPNGYRAIDSLKH